MRLPKSSWFLVGILLLSLLGNGALLISLRRLYARQLEQQIWPLGRSAPPRIQEGSAPGEPAILLVGDSRMEQWPLPQGWPYRFIQAGEGGLTASQLHLRLPALLEKYHPEAVVIEAGINDLKYLGLRPEQSEALVAQTANHLHELSALAAQRGAKVMLLETWPPAPPNLVRRIVWSGAVAPAVAQMNKRLRAFGREPGGPMVVDLVRESGVQPNRVFYRDTLHFTREAYARMTPVFRHALDSLLIPAPASLPPRSAAPGTATRP